MVVNNIKDIINKCFTGEILTDSTNFSSELYKTGNTYIMQLSPRKKQYQKFFKVIKLVSTKGDNTLNSIEIHQSAEDILKILFTNKKVNQNIADRLFDAL